MHKFSKNEIHAISFRLLQVACWLLSGKLVVKFAGTETYGLFSAFLSISALFQLFDFGILNYLRTEFAALVAIKKSERVASLYWSGLVLLIGFFLAAFFACGIFGTVFPQQLISFLSAETVVGSTTLLWMVLTLVCYVFFLFLTNLLMAYRAAKHDQYRVIRLNIFGCILQVLSVVGVSRISTEPALLFAAFLVPLHFTGALASLAQVFKLNQNWKIDLRPLLNRHAWSFFFIQAGGVLTNSIDVLLVSHLFGLAEAASYNLLKMLTQFPISLHAHMMQQSWPRYSNFSVAKGGLESISQLFRRNLLLSVVFGVIVFLGISLLGPTVIQLFFDSEVLVSWRYSALFGLFGLIFIISNNYSILMFSLNYTSALLRLAFLAPAIFVGLVFGFSAFGPKVVILSSILVTSFGLFIGIFFKSQRFSNWLTKRQSQYQE